MDNPKKYLEMAFREALESPCEDIQKGAVIYHPDIDWITPGFNKKPYELEFGTYQISLPIHAETAAILRAASLGRKTNKSIMFTCFLPFADDALAIVESGIKEIYTYKHLCDLAISSEWEPTIEMGLKVLKENNVKLTIWDEEINFDPILFEGELFYPKKNEYT